MRRTLARRLEKLEGRRDPSYEPFRVMMTLPWKKLDLSKSTVLRYRCENGTLVEVVQLDGAAADLADAELERFIQSFPIRKQGDPANRQ